MRRLVGAAAALVLAACAPADDAARSPTAAPPAELAVRLDAIDASVAAWAGASSLEDAREAAERARNLVVGPAGPLYGDADGDGTVAGASEIGLLPGLDGEPGLAGPPAATSCALADVLGGDWDDARARWDVALAAIDAWAPGSNTFPSLPSHPQRVVGWATLTLEADALDHALEYAGHARLHANITRAAYERCP